MIYAENDFDKITMDQLLGEVEELLGGPKKPKKKKKVTIPQELERAMSEDRYYKTYPEKKPGMFNMTQEQINNERKKLYSGISTNTVSEKTTIKYNNPGYDLSQNQKTQKRDQDELNRKENAIIPNWVTPQGLIEDSYDVAKDIVNETEKKVSSWLDWFKDLEWYWYIIMGAGAVLALYLLIKVV